MINIELMSKLYLVVVHNLNKGRKTRDGSKKKNTEIPEQLKVGHNILVRHQKHSNPNTKISA